jgi:hypothetical protein
VCGAFLSRLFSRRRAVFHGGHFGVDGNHRVAETVQFVFRFAFGRLDHERAGDGPRERRRVKAVIHQPLRHVLGGGDAVERAQIQNALVRDEAVAAVERREIIFQPLGNVIRVEDGVFRRLGQSVRAHHRDIHPRNRQNARAAPRRGADRADVLLGMIFFEPRGEHRMARQKRNEMFRHANRPDARSAAAVRNAKRLVQIQMAHVRADEAGAVRPTCAFMFAPSM